VKRLILFLAVASMAAISFSAAPSLMNYQGLLTDQNGIPLLNVNRSVDFTIYDGPGGGAVIKWGPETHSVTTDGSGRFNEILGQGVPPVPITDAFFSGDERWLGIKVAADPELSPRTRITTSAYAHRISTVDGATGGTITGNVDIQSTLSVDDIDVGSSSQTGLTETYMSGTATPIVIVSDWGADGGRVDLFDELGNFMIRNEADASGSGGFFQVYRSVGLVGFLVDGNSGGTNEPFVSVSGSARSATFVMGSAGNPSVALPTDAIASPEIFDEPGVASSTTGGPYNPTASTAPMTSRTITPPADGYVIAIGSCEYDVIHTTGTTDRVDIGLSTSSTTIPSDQELTLYVDDALPTGEYLEQAASVEVFPVSALVPTPIYYNCDSVSGGGNMYDINLSLLFVPTFYGTVSALAGAAEAPSLDSSPNEQSKVAASSSLLDLEQERLQSIADNNARIEKELAAMKAQLEELKKQVEENGNLSNLPSQQQ